MMDKYFKNLIELEKFSHLKRKMVDRLFDLSNQDLTFLFLNKMPIDIGIYDSNLVDEEKLMIAVAIVTDYSIPRIKKELENLSKMKSRESKRKLTFYTFIKNIFKKNE